MSALTRHFGRKAAFVDEEEPRRIEIAPAAPRPRLAFGLHIKALLLAGVGSLFMPLTATADSVIAFGQSRALVVWQRIIMRTGLQS